MRKIILMIAIVGLLAGCAKKNVNDFPIDKWNGYESFYKAGEMYKDLRTRHGVVGQVTYGIDDSANFYVTYETNSDWELMSTQMYAGEWKFKPRSRPHHPKIWRFPHKTVHNPYVNTYTYYIPLTQLPPAEEPGFVVAAHAFVHSTAKCGNGKVRRAWADWDRRFSCRSWGGYSIYYYNEPYEPHTLLYATQYRNDSVTIYLIDVTSGNADLVSTEYVGTTPTGTYDGAAWDPVTGYFFFTTYPEQELWVNRMDSTDSFLSGSLSGVAASGTFGDGNFYYVNETNNDVMEVSFDTAWQVASENVMSTIPGTIDVTDIAISPTGQFYMVGVYNDTVQLIELDRSSGTDVFTTTNNVDLGNNPQIAFGDDGLFYAVTATSDGNGSIISELNPSTGQIISADTSNIVPVPFSDLTGGGMR